MRISDWSSDVCSSDLAAARVREARAQEALARAQLFPTLDAGLSASHSRSVSALGSASETGSVQPVFQFAYEVDLFRRLDSQVEAARAAYLASAAARDAAPLSVAAPKIGRASCRERVWRDV